MSNAKCWGGHPELLAISRQLNCIIYILKGCSEHQITRIAPNDDLDDGSLPKYWICYHDNHYDALVDLKSETCSRSTRYPFRRSQAYQKCENGTLTTTFETSQTGIITQATSTTTATSDANILPVTHGFTERQPESTTETKHELIFNSESVKVSAKVRKDDFLCICNIMETEFLLEVDSAIAVGGSSLVLKGITNGQGGFKYCGSGAFLFPGNVIVTKVVLHDNNSEIKVSKETFCLEKIAIWNAALAIGDECKDYANQLYYPHMLAPRLITRANSSCPSNDFLFGTTQLPSGKWASFIFMSESTGDCNELFAYLRRTNIVNNKITISEGFRQVLRTLAWKYDLLHSALGISHGDPSLNNMAIVNVNHVNGWRPEGMFVKYDNEGNPLLNERFSIILMDFGMAHSKAFPECTKKRKQSTDGLGSKRSKCILQSSQTRKSIPQVSQNLSKRMKWTSSSDLKSLIEEMELPDTFGGTPGFMIDSKRDQNCSMFDHSVHRDISAFTLIAVAGLVRPKGKTWVSELVNCLHSENPADLAKFLLKHSGCDGFLVQKNGNSPLEDPILNPFFDILFSVLGPKSIGLFKVAKVSFHNMLSAHPFLNTVILKKEEFDQLLGDGIITKGGEVEIFDGNLKRKRKVSQPRFILTFGEFGINCHPYDSIPKDGYVAIYTGYLLDTLYFSKPWMKHTSHTLPFLMGDINLYIMGDINPVTPFAYMLGLTPESRGIVRVGSLIASSYLDKDATNCTHPRQNPWYGDAARNSAIRITGQHLLPDFPQMVLFATKNISGRHYETHLADANDIGLAYSYEFTMKENFSLGSWTTMRKQSATSDPLGDLRKRKHTDGLHLSVNRDLPSWSVVRDSASRKKVPSKRKLYIGSNL